MEPEVSRKHASQRDMEKPASPNMEKPKAFCVLANMGTIGDFKPAFLAAACSAHQGERVVVVAQPKHEPFVVQKMGTAVGFAQREETQLDLAGERQEHVFHPPKPGCPPKVESGEQFFVATYRFQKLTYAADSGAGCIVFYFPTAEKGGMNEDEYQTANEPGKAALKKDTFGAFLSLWQGAFSALMNWHDDFPRVFVTNCYDREVNVALFEKATGIATSLKLRVSHLGLGDVDLTDKWHAVSSILAPQDLFGKDVAGLEKRGVIVEPRDVFPPQGLPAEVATFLEAKPSAVFVLSSVSAQWTNAIRDILPGSTTYHVLFVNAASGQGGSVKEGHYCFPEPLADLDAAFKKAALVIHGGGVGISEQAVRSGTPSICLSSMVEQELNGSRLEALAIAKHFKIGDVLQDGTGFVSTVADFFQGEATFYDSAAVESCKEQVLRECTAALPALSARLRSLPWSCDDFALNVDRQKKNGEFGSVFPSVADEKELAATIPSPPAAAIMSATSNPA